jgi:hypothetical protein
LVVVGKRRKSHAAFLCDEVLIRQIAERWLVMRKKVLKKTAKKSEPKGEPRLFLSYPDHVIVTGNFAFADDSIDEEFRKPPRVGAIVRLVADDPMRAEEEGDIAFKVLAVNAKTKSGSTKLKLTTPRFWRVCGARLTRRFREPAWRAPAMSKPIGGSEVPARNEANQRQKVRGRTKRKPKRRKRKHRRRSRHRGGDMLNVACTRCEYRIQMSRMIFGRESRRASRCRCPLCGGNVVLTKYVDVREKES